MKSPIILSAILLLTLLLAPTLADAHSSRHNAPPHHCRLVHAGLVSCPAPRPSLAGAVPANVLPSSSATGGTPALTPSDEGQEEPALAEGVAATGGTPSTE
jgi:hypothetical protein